MKKKFSILLVMLSSILFLSADPFTEGYMQGYRDALAGRPNRFEDVENKSLFKVTFFVNAQGETTDKGYVAYIKTPKGSCSDGQDIRWNIVADQKDISIVIWDGNSRQLKGNAKFPSEYKLSVTDIDGVVHEMKGVNHTDRIIINERDEARGLLYSGTDLKVTLAEDKENGLVYDLGIMRTEGFQELYFSMLGIAIAEGPSGGYIFYDKGFYSDGWRYLEAAPADLRVVDGMITVDSTRSGYDEGIAHFPFGYYRDGAKGQNKFAGTSVDIGKGKLNTETLVKLMGESAYISTKSATPNYAAALCTKLVYGGADDWFLPSRDELDLLSSSLKAVGVGDIDSTNYWSSSENNRDYAWNRNFSRTESGFYDKNGNMKIRPIRAF